MFTEQEIPEFMPASRFANVDKRADSALAQCEDGARSAAIHLGNESHRRYLGKFAHDTRNPRDFRPVLTESRGHDHGTRPVLPQVSENLLDGIPVGSVKETRSSGIQT
jgi:hypothetical protein